MLANSMYEKEYFNFDKMNNFELRKLLTSSIKGSFLEIRDDIFFEIDRDYKVSYFIGRR